MSTAWIYDRPPTHLDTGKHQSIWVWHAYGCAVSYAYSAVPAGRPWAPGSLPAPTTAPEPMDKDDFKGLQQQISAISARLDRLEGAGKTEPDAEPPPGEWRNDRPPAGSDGCNDGMVWCWYGNESSGSPSRLDAKTVRLMYAAGGRPWWFPGHQPAPTSPPPQPQPEPPTGKWIVGPLPTEADANFENDVKVPNVLDPTCPYEWAKYYVVQPGAPWCSPDDNPGPWDPATLDRNGWIRSRLPTAGDASHTVGDASHVGSWVITPIKPGSELFSFQHYTLVVPGQPWAPCGSEPGPYQP